MKQNDFYEVDGCMDFIPVKLIEHKHMINTLKVEVAETGFKIFVPSIYRFQKVNEPQKPVVPKFVAEWIELCKANDVTLLGGISPIDELVSTICSEKGVKSRDATRWAKKNQETFARAWLDGYTVEKEKLYTVEIPNPNINTHTILQKVGEGIVLIMVTNARWRGLTESKLTEAEIKKDFDWAWDAGFAKEVDE